MIFVYFGGVVRKIDSEATGVDVSDVIDVESRWEFYIVYSLVNLYRAPPLGNKTVREAHGPQNPNQGGGVL